jgi:hypothetical protein
MPPFQSLIWVPRGEACEYAHKAHGEPVQVLVRVTIAPREKHGVPRASYSLITIFHAPQLMASLNSLPSRTVHYAVLPVEG